jgi:hypothetical protein
MLVKVKNKKTFVEFEVDDDFFKITKGFSLSKSKYGYLRILLWDNSIKKYEFYTYHRYVMMAEKGQIVDHINRNTYDNRRENLRFVTKAQNAYNTEKTRPDRIHSKFKGVSKIGNSWRCCFTFNKKQLSKCFQTEIEAAIYYNYLCEKNAPKYAIKNIIPDAFKDIIPKEGKIGNNQFSRRS